MNNNQYDFETTNISCPIESITGIWEFKRPSYFRFMCYSLSGHLLHLVTKGSYVVKINSREYNVKEGDIVYYYGSEEVETIGNKHEVNFYSISFQAPKVLPLPFEMRVFAADKNLQSLFQKLHEEFSTQDIMSTHYNVYALLLSILNNIDGIYFDSYKRPLEEELWWSIERRIRKDKIFRPSLNDLLRISGYSRSTVIRSCHKATGNTPINRIQTIRMEEAKSLLNFAHLNVTQVSEYLGYPRIHEFSREFSKYYGVPPSNLLQKRFNEISEKK
ncbi:AraC family transcriptional regulator [Arenibacter algicola]|uniref:AraC family transcriptional regulator n=1 Tax=Arenibacter algicola TaxID=616991 RepID=UPI001C067AA2|nr:AraC family transcriptional regulator [Arenibacter algicola]MBU2903603.1 AraC family transcriptional regulator [Arenibacter algicola]